MRNASYEAEEMSNGRTEIAAHVLTSRQQVLCYDVTASSYCGSAWIDGGRMAESQLSRPAQFYVHIYGWRSGGDAPMQFHLSVRFIVFRSIL